MEGAVVAGLEIQYVRRANGTDADTLSCDTVIDVRPTPEIRQYVSQN